MKRASALRRKGHIYREIGEELGISEGYAHALLNPRKPQRRPTKRLRLSLAGELRALLRLMPEHEEWNRRLKEAITLIEQDHEVIEARVRIDDVDLPITLDEDTSRALRAHAWERLEQALVEANSAYNQQEWSSPHERAKELLWAATDIKKYADVVYALTPVPDGEIEAGS